MKDNLIEILPGLDNKNQAAISKERDALKVLDNSKLAGKFIKGLLDELNTEDCLHCNNQPFCRFYLTFAYIKINNVHNALQTVAEAIEGFHVRGLEWNHAMAYWLQGVIHLEEGSNNLAQHSLERALSILTPMIKVLKTESNYKKARNCEENITQIHKDLDKAHLTPITRTAPATTPALATESPVSISTPENITIAPEGCIIISSVPIYEEVEAGPNGPVWNEQLEIGKMEFKGVVLQSEYYKIYSTKYGERQVTISPDKKFAWAKVHGHSMNISHPIPINEGDYVLFYQANSPERNEIVIAAKADNSDGSNYMVKRYLIDEKLLESETSEQDAIYNPITITPEYRILGIVVAIAKPA